MDYNERNGSYSDDELLSRFSRPETPRTTVQDDIPDDPAAFTACGCKESRSVEQSEIERKRCLSLRPTEEAPPRRPVPFQTRRLPRINRRNTGPTTADENPPSLSDTNGPAGGAGRNTSGLLPHIITELHEFEGGSILPRTEHVRDRSFYIRRSRLAVIISD